MELLEGQVLVIQNEVSDMETDVDFLFDEQIIQDERLLNLEEETDVIDTRLIIIDNDLEGTNYVPALIKERNFQKKIQITQNNMAKRCHFVIIGLQVTTLALEYRVMTLEEIGNQTISELEVRVEALEGTAADHETRISITESGLTGRCDKKHCIFHLK